MKRPSIPLLLALISPALHAQHQTQTLTTPHVDASIPYSIELREVSLAPAPLPNIHSFTAGEWEGEWVILAGRTNGLHGMTGRNAFDPAYDNREVWVINPHTRQSWRKSLDDSASSGLSSDLVDSLSCTNTEFYQDEENLIVVGGYGYKRSASDHVTYDRITLIHLPGLIDWVKSPAGSETARAADHIQQVTDSYFQVTGGGLEKIGDEFQLIFGQNYPGRYRPNFNGTYTRQIRRFKIETEEGFSIPSASKIATPTNDAFRRRDLNIVTILERRGLNSFEEKALALSGVFTPDNGIWTVPVLIGASGNVVMDDPDAATTLRQALHIYHSAKATLFQRVTNESHTLLFGGLTVLERDPVSGDFTQDNQAPFTNQCSLVVRDSDGLFTQYWLPTRFPAILSSGKELLFGTNAEFFPAPTTPMLHPRVIDLAAIRSSLVIGHIFGGIVADAGNNGNTGASGRVFEVVLHPAPPNTQLFIHSSPSPHLSWSSLPDAHYLIEESQQLELWQELSPPLTDTDSWPITLSKPRNFYRLLSTTATSP